MGGSDGGAVLGRRGLWRGGIRWEAVMEGRYKDLGGCIKQPFLILCHTVPN